MPHSARSAQRHSLCLHARPANRMPPLPRAYVAATHAAHTHAGVILVWTTIVLLLTSSSKDERRRGGGGGGFGGGNGMGGLRMAMDLSDLFIYFDPYYWRTRQQRQQAGQSMGFIEAIFSVVFGKAQREQSACYCHPLSPQTSPSMAPPTWGQ